MAAAPEGYTAEALRAALQLELEGDDARYGEWLLAALDAASPAQRLAVVQFATGQLAPDRAALRRWVQHGACEDSLCTATNAVSGPSTGRLELGRAPSREAFDRKWSSCSSTQPAWRCS